MSQFGLALEHRSWAHGCLTYSPCSSDISTTLVYLRENTQFCSALCVALVNENSPQNWSTPISSSARWRQRALRNCESERSERSPHVTAYRMKNIPCTDNSDAELRTGFGNHGQSESGEMPTLQIWPLAIAPQRRVIIYTPGVRADTI
jgi:hypothetical protein